MFTHTSSKLYFFTEQALNLLKEISFELEDDTEEKIKYSLNNSSGNNSTKENLKNLNLYSSIENGINGQFYHDNNFPKRIKKETEIQYYYKILLDQFIVNPKFKFDYSFLNLDDSGYEKYMN